MTAEKKTYNGWSNYETWNVALWIGNEEGSDRYWREITQECWDAAGDGLSAYAKFTGREIFTREKRAELALADRLKDEIEEAAPELGASMWSDLLNAALSEVDWREIAANWISDCDQSDPEEDEDVTEDD